MKRKHKRLAIVLTGLVLLGSAAGVVAFALKDNIVFFHSPSSVAAEPPPPGRAIRLGGLVEEGSVEKQSDGVTTHFRITDLAESIPVVYTGLLPDLFREGQGVVTEGSIDPSGVFQAREVLAKHDENYMPAEVAEALKEAGQWQGGESAAGSGEQN